jgi:hypothetical protein
MTALRAHGLSLSLLPGWDLQIYRRSPQDGSVAYPVLHAANFPLPRTRGDFGIGAVEHMRSHHVLVVVFEYEPQAASTALFAREGRPRPRPADFHPKALQRTLPGQGGAQWFFTESARPFSLYVVLGSFRQRASLVPMVRSLLDDLVIAPRRSRV